MDIRVKWALANACAVWSTTGVIKMERSKLDIGIANVTVAMAVRSICSCSAVTAIIRPHWKLCISIAIAYVTRILSGRSESRHEATNAGSRSVCCYACILLVLESESTKAMKRIAMD